MGYEWDFQVVFRHFDVLWQGVGATIRLTGAALAFGLLIGVIAAMVKLSPLRLARIPAEVYIEVFRNTPMLVQLLWIYYAVPLLTGVDFETFEAAVITLSLHAGAFFAEIVRGGIVSIERGQWDAGRALGMTSWTLMRRIILPQALIRMIPALANQGVSLLKATSVFGAIVYADIMYQAMRLNAELYRPLEVFTVTAGIYLVILGAASQGVAFLERYLSRSAR